MPSKVRSVTKLIDNRHRNRPSNTVQAVVTNTEEALSSKPAKMPHSILQHNKRKQFLKAQQGRAGGRSSSGTRRNVDVELADPAITALRGGGRTRSGVVTNMPDGLGGVAKNAMMKRERFGHRIVGAEGVVSFLQSLFRERAGSEGEEGMRKYFATWSSYRMRKVHVGLIGKKEIYRPNSILEGIDGTREMYHFVGANTPKYDAQTTTKGLEDIELVLKREGGSLDGRRGEPIGGAGGGQSDT